MLTLSGERVAAEVPEDQGDTQRRNERRFGKFSRSFKVVYLLLNALHKMIITRS